MSESQALSLASYELCAQQQRRISIPKRFTVPMREMLALQPRFTQTQGQAGHEAAGARRFRAAYDFMCCGRRSARSTKRPPSSGRMCRRSRWKSARPAFQVSAQPRKRKAATAPRPQSLSRLAIHDATIVGARPILVSAATCKVLRARSSPPSQLLDELAGTRLFACSAHVSICAFRRCGAARLRQRRCGGC